MMRDQDFWLYLIERETIRLRRRAGWPRERWTDNWIFKEFSFTNAKRDDDRTTALLKRDIYEHHPQTHPSPVALMNAATFRFFGTIDTARIIGWREELDVASFLDPRLTFTSAYIVPSCGRTGPKAIVVGEIVADIVRNADSILATDSWEEMCARARRCYGVGSFMAKEVLLDYMIITRWLPTDWQTWTPVGPGGRRGAGVVLNDEIKMIPERDALEVIRALYAQRHDRWPREYVRLDLTDIQFALCEFAKYEKARTGVGRPKRGFRPTIDSVTTDQ